MKCEDVQENLSDYLDKLLDTALARTVEAHLAGCARCADSLRELRECREIIARMPIVEPPAAFIAGVMARIRQLPVEQKSWRRWLISWPVMIPVQVTALLLIGVVSIYLVPQEQRLKSDQRPENATITKNAPEPGQTVEETATSSSTVNVTHEEPNQDKPRNPTTQTAKGNRTAHAQPARSPVKQVTARPALETTAPIAEPPPEIPFPRSRPIVGAIGVNQGPGGTRVSPTMEQLIQERGMGPGFPDRAFSPAIPAGPDYELVLQPHTPSRAEAREDREGQGEPGERSPVGMQSAAFYRIPADKYEAFKRELASQGTIVSEKAAPKQQESFWPTDQLIVKVTTLPPK